LLENLKVPVIACVNGFALGGGCEMAMACDFIYASENAVFGQPEVKLGLIPGFGGTQRLAKYIGRAAAKEIIYSGRNVKIDEALERGLVLQKFANKEEMITAATTYLQKMMRNSPVAIDMAKRAIERGVDLKTVDGLEVELSFFADVFNSEDMQEGTKAFLEKRNAQFPGR
jgi:enoyl-CoA hydratase